MVEFSQAARENLRSYVYFLQDPRDGEVFYVGKGVGNRVFSHLAESVETDAETEKIERIREIRSGGCEVQHFILRHGLTPKEAFEVEAALIDFLGRDNLSNVMGGRYSQDFGLKTAGEISAMYDAERLDTELPIILINLNRRYRWGITEAELYEATRKFWVLGHRRNRAKYAVPTYRGLTREVYEIEEWYHSDDRNRWAFNGKRVLDESIRKELIYKSINHLFSPGAANPIKYINCD